MFFFLLFSSSPSWDGLVKKTWLFRDGFYAKQQHIFYWAVHQPITFSQLQSLTKASNQSLKNYTASFVTPFSSLVGMHTNHLAMKRNYYSKLMNLKLWLVCMETGRVFVIDCRLGVAWSVILQPILHTSTEEAYEDRLVALWYIDGKLQIQMGSNSRNECNQGAVQSGHMRLALTEDTGLHCTHTGAVKESRPLKHMSAVMRELSCAALC